MGLTSDRNDPGLREIKPDGQQKNYLVLSDEERAKGFVRPVRTTYRHVACGSNTTMPAKIAETYARNPKFYNGTMCCACRDHFPLRLDEFEAFTVENAAFLWLDGSPVGS